MAKIIAIANQKGGVGKTTTTVNLGIGLARHEKKVLLIDADAQGNLTDSLGWKEPDKLSVSLTTIMTKVIMDEPISPSEGILHHAEGVDLIPANIELSAMEVSLVNTMSREVILRNYLNEVKDKYDYVLIDCMPSLGMLTVNALVAADSVIIPVQAHYLPAKGMAMLDEYRMEHISRINTDVAAMEVYSYIKTAMGLEAPSYAMHGSDGRTLYRLDSITITSTAEPPHMELTCTLIIPASMFNSTTGGLEIRLDMHIVSRNQRLE